MPLPSQGRWGLAVASLLLLGGCAPQTRVAFLGDSITARGHWQQAFPHLRVSNLGVPGDQATDVLARLDGVRATHARLVVLMVGINDLRAGEPPERVAARIHLIRHQLLAKSSPLKRVVVLSTLQCRPVPPSQPLNGCTSVVRAGVARLNQMLRQQLPPGAFLDLNPVMSPGGRLRGDLSVDGIHLNGAGYGEWNALLEPLLQGV